jgi:GNAT superfamily N-acetyltransferase
VVDFRLRAARLEDCLSLEKLIARSVRELGAGDYTPEQMEGALQGAFGVDTQLIRDQTYFVAETDGIIVGCGGWGKRRTLFGSDACAERDAGMLNPRMDAAKIRAFFIDPDYARRGIGKALLDRCEAEARIQGFSRYELMATLPGVRLYVACGYVPRNPVQYSVGQGVMIEFVPMDKLTT